jgi:hypothetical protein
LVLKIPLTKGRRDRDRIEEKIALINNTAYLKKKKLSIFVATETVLERVA